MGKTIVHQGGAGAGQHTKMVNQILIATGMIGVCEALLYGYKSGLDLPTRELLTFAMLVAHGGCDPQVRGHVTANLNVGNSRELLIDVLTQLLPFIGYPRTLSGLRAVDEMAPLPS